jgi:hypothetical protein
MVNRHQLTRLPTVHQWYQPESLPPRRGCHDSHGFSAWSRPTKSHPLHLSLCACFRSRSYFRFRILISQPISAHSNWTFSMVITIPPCCSVTRLEMDASRCVSGRIFQHYPFLTSAWLQLHENVQGRLALCCAAVSLPKVGPWHLVYLCFCTLQCASLISHAAPWVAAFLVMLITSHRFNTAAYCLSVNNSEESCAPSTTIEASTTCPLPLPTVYD